MGVPPRARIPRPRRGLGFTLIYFGIFWGSRPKPCLRPRGFFSRACGPCYYMLNLLKLRFTKNGGFCQNCVMDANVKTTLRVFGRIGKPFYLCNVERISV